MSPEDIEDRHPVLMAAGTGGLFGGALAAALLWQWYWLVVGMSVWFVTAGIAALKETFGNRA